MSHLHAFRLTWREGQVDMVSECWRHNQGGMLWYLNIVRIRVACCGIWILSESGWHAMVSEYCQNQDGMLWYLYTDVRSRMACYGIWMLTSEAGWHASVCEYCHQQQDGMLRYLSADVRGRMACFGISMLKTSEVGWHAVVSECWPQKQDGMICYLNADVWSMTMCNSICMLTSEAGIDGISQLQTIVNGSASRRTEFVYNIDDVTNRSAIRLFASCKVKEWQPQTFADGLDKVTLSLCSKRAFLPKHWLLFFPVLMISSVKICTFRVLSRNQFWIKPYQKVYCFISERIAGKRKRILNGKF